MKICFVTLEYPHPKTGTSGGIGTSILNLSKGLVQLGHAVSIVIYTQLEDAVFVENGITHYQVKSVKFKGLSFYLSQKKVERLLNRLYQEQKIDVVEFAEWTGFSSFIQPKCPVVVKLHGSDTYFCHLDGRKVKWNNTFLEKKALQQADGIIAVSAFTGQMTKQLFQLKKAFEVIPNAIDTAQFQSLPIDHDSLTLLYFGTLIRKKGMLELPFIFNEVYKKNKQVQLILVGNNALDIAQNWTPTWELMQPLFDKDALQKVSYLQSVPYESIKKIISEATVCVFPTFAEALPVSWIEAMAMEKPIVASNIGWAKEIIDDGVNGFLEHPKNHEAFASKICALLSSKELQNQIGAAARKKASSTFSLEVVAQQSVAFYKRICEAHESKI